MSFLNFHQHNVTTSTKAQWYLHIVIAAVATLFFHVFVARAEEPANPMAEYGVQNPGQPYPVTFFDSKKVGVFDIFSSSRNVFWLDSETPIYPIKVPLKEGERPSYPRKSTINTLDLKTLKTEMVTEGIGFCYDMDAKYFAVLDAQAFDKESQIVTTNWRHGIFGKKLTATTSTTTRANSPFRIQLYGCPDPKTKEPYILDGITMTKLPRNHGHIGWVDPFKVTEQTGPVGTYQFISPDGVKKRFSVHTSKFGRAFGPYLNPAANEYFIYLYESDRSLTIWRYNSKFDLISETNLKKYSWPLGASPDVSKNGYLFYKPSHGLGHGGYLYLLTFDGKIVEVLRGFGFLGWLSVSPDGCRALFLSEASECCKIPPVPATIELCGPSN